jgi:hypothetical protein
MSSEAMLRESMEIPAKTESEFPLNSSPQVAVIISRIVQGMGSVVVIDFYYLM